jgi:type II secretory pathway pseudopilin PulG
MKKNNNIFKREYGGMLVELMLSVAIAAILIPFIFRYQQNTVERARNIAVTQQMETVQGALERYIIIHRNELLQAVGDNITTIGDGDRKGLDILFAENLISADFKNEYRNDYILKILKRGAAGTPSVLQGVVLLNNGSNSNLRTREIANLGGGKIGYITGNTVQGAFNVFRESKGSFDLGNFNSGVVGTTSTFRGSSDYLWRKPSGNESDATMLSKLNLEGQDIVNIKDASANRAFFNGEIKANEVSVDDKLFFTGRPILNNLKNINDSTGHYFSTSAFVNGSVAGSNNSSLGINGFLNVTDTGQFGDLISNKLYIHNGDVKVTGFYAGDKNDSQKIAHFSQSINNMSVNKIDVSDGILITMEGSETNPVIAGVSPKLTVTNFIIPVKAKQVGGEIVNIDIPDDADFATFDELSRTWDSQTDYYWWWDKTNGAIGIFNNIAFPVRKFACRLDYMDKYESVTYNNEQVDGYYREDSRRANADYTYRLISNERFSINDDTCKEGEFVASDVYVDIADIDTRLSKIKSAIVCKTNCLKNIQYYIDEQYKYPVCQCLKECGFTPNYNFQCNGEKWVGCEGFSPNSCGAGYIQTDTCEWDGSTYYKCEVNPCTGYDITDPAQCRFGASECQSGSTIKYKCNPEQPGQGDDLKPDDDLIK